MRSGDTAVADPTSVSKEEELSHAAAAATEAPTADASTKEKMESLETACCSGSATMPSHVALDVPD